jgi:glycerophosphoryl diester phosphodiesterase
MKNEDGLVTRRDFVQMVGAGMALAFLPGCASSKAHASKADPFYSGQKFVVGHRGACAYAPENTLPSYELAIKQGADYVEQDLQISRDGVLMCGHDTTLERVSNVEEVFPDRFTEQVVKGKKVKHWYIHDFTVKELKQLDFGAKFDPKFKGTTIPTWQEAIDLIKGRAGLCPETKGPEAYGKLGFNMEAMVVEVMKKNGIDKPRAGASTPIFLQSFSKTSLQRLVHDHDIKWPMLWLTFKGAKWTPEIFAEAKQYCTSIGPYKGEVTASLVEQAHAHGLKVVPFTFNARDNKDFKSVDEEMRYALYNLGVDGMFTDNPDLFPRVKKG